MFILKKKLFLWSIVTFYVMHTFNCRNISINITNYVMHLLSNYISTNTLITFFLFKITSSLNDIDGHYFFFKSYLSILKKFYWGVSNGKSKLKSLLSSCKLNNFPALASFYFVCMACTMFIFKIYWVQIIITLQVN